MDSFTDGSGDDVVSTLTENGGNTVEEPCLDDSDVDNMSVTHAQWREFRVNNK